MPIECTALDWWQVQRLETSAGGARSVAIDREDVRVRATVLGFQPTPLGSDAASASRFGARFRHAASSAIATARLLAPLKTIVVLPDAPHFPAAGVKVCRGASLTPSGDVH